MPLNLLIKYNKLLDIKGMSETQRKKSLQGVFNRDIRNNPLFLFQNKKIHPTPEDGKDSMERLFTHLTTKIIDKNARKREFDLSRSIRLHWVKFHSEEQKTNNMLIFSVKEPDGIRIYIYDKDEEYVIILEPLRNKTAYYLLSAYYIEGKDKARNKMQRKYNRKLSEIL